MTRFSSKRFVFDVENYDGGDVNKTRMKHIKIYDEGAMQVDLWLTPDDVGALKNAIDYNSV